MNGTYRSKDYQERPTASDAQDVESVAHVEQKVSLGARSAETARPWLTEDARRVIELSAALAELQAELGVVRGSLAQRYQPDLEARGQRLMLERDEALMVWGQLILGLCELGGELRLDWPPEIEERDRSETVIWSAELAAQLALSGASSAHVDDDLSLDSDERTLGISRWDMNAYPSEAAQSAPASASRVIAHRDDDSVSQRSPQLETQLEVQLETSTAVTQDPVERTEHPIVSSGGALGVAVGVTRDEHNDEAPNETSGGDVASPSSSLSSSSPSDVDEVMSSTAEPDLSDEEDTIASPVGEADAPKVSLTHFSLEDLRKNMKPSWGHDGISDEPLESNEYAVELLKRIGPPRDFTQLKEHLIELEEEVECCQRWSSFTQGVQHGVVTLITSRLRGIQELLGENAFDQDRIAKMFRRLTRFSSDFRPGFVHGLSREKIPEHDNWRVDEVYAWRRLEKLLKLPPHLPPISPSASEKLERLKELLKREDEVDDFSNQLRRAVTECLNGGLSPESPHLTRILTDQLSHLSGKRFKKLRSAVSSPTM